ncbi:NAD(P)H-binding protein [Haloactinopolyspora sp.]|uniref:NAD(P)-dependent oxidoreductase n=1 Tax=Haloactinopolyspora sp. TaxID=1966353 RepID=UPI002617116E|nr:NAD(P)H-binding protein [Haloactinopolyspora sp.]
MRIAIFGGTGQVGSRAMAEALARGHDVTAVVRDQARVPGLPAGVRTWVGDAARTADVAAVSAGHDLVISATRPPDGREQELVTTTRSLLAGLRGTDVRLLVVGGAASLKVPGSPGVTVLDDPRYLSAGYRDIALACNDQLAVCRAETAVGWTYLSPPASMEPGTRTGSYRTGSDELVTDADGRSWISLEDLAVALLDEAERPKHQRDRFTVGY